MTEAERKETLARIEQLMGATAGMPELVELEELVRRVVEYEEEVWRSRWRNGLLTE